MKAALLYILIAVGGMLVRPGALAQGVRIGADAAGPPDASALLDLDVTGMADMKGILLPRMTESQRDNIASPSESLLIYQTDGTAGFKYYDGANWVGFGGGGGSDDLGDHTATDNIGLNGNWISGDGDNEGITIANNGNIGLGVAAAQANLHAAGPFRIDNLAGSGTRIVVADADGDLTTQTLPTPTSLSSSSNKSINSASYSGGNSVMDDITLEDMPAGTYLVQYSLVFSGSSDGAFIINAGGSSVAASERFESTGNVSGMAVVTLASTGDIQLRGRKDSGGPGFTVTHRTLTAVPTN